MATKSLRFSIYQLIISGENLFTVRTFSSIVDSKLETSTITHSEEEKETISIKKVSKYIFDDRFVCIYFNEGDKFPYSPTVIDSVDLQEKENPRSPEDFEMDDQFFIVVDVLTQRLYLSDQRRKGTLLSWFKSTISKEVIIKSVIDEASFLDNMASINKVSFAVTPNLLTSISQDTLSNHIAEDIYGFGAERATLSLEYRSTHMNDTIKNKLKAILQQRIQFNDITIIGRSDEGFESVFNLDGVINKITIDISVPEKTNLLDCSIVFKSLTDKIKGI